MSQIQADYLIKLKSAKVILDPEERRTVIWAQCRDRALKEGLTVKQDEGLLDEVTGLVEWPVVLMGKIDDAVHDRAAGGADHLHAHATRNTSRSWTRPASWPPRFLVVANIETPTTAAR